VLAENEVEPAYAAGERLTHDEAFDLALSITQ